MVLIEEIEEPSSTILQDENVPVETRSCFDCLVNSEKSSQPASKRVEEFLASIVNHLNTKEQRNYVIRRLILGVSSRRKSANIDFANALWALLSLETFSHLFTIEKVDEVLRNEINLKKILKASVLGAEESNQVVACITTLTVLTRSKDYVSLQLGPLLHQYFLKHREEDANKLYMSYDWWLYFSMDKVRKSIYKEHFFPQFETVYKAKRQHEKPLSINMCLELLSIRRRFPKLMAKLGIVDDSWTIFTVYPLENFVSDVRKFMPFKHPALKAFVQTYPIGNSAFNQLWDVLIKGSSNFDKEMFWSLFEYASTDSNAEAAIILTLFSEKTLDLVESLHGKRKTQKDQTKMFYGLVQKISPCVFPKLLIHLLKHFERLSNFLLHGTAFSYMIRNVDKESHLKVCRRLGKLINSCTSKEMKGKMLILVTVLLKAENINFELQKESADVLYSLLMKFAVFKENSGAPKVDEIAVQHVSKALKVSKGVHEDNFIKSYKEVLSAEKSENLKCPDIIKKCEKLLKDEAFTLKRVVVATVLDISLNHPSSRSSQQETYLTKFVDSSAPKTEPECVLPLLISLLGVSGSHYESLVSAEFKRLVECMEDVSTFVGKMFEFYDSAFASCPGNEDENEDGGDSESEKSDSGGEEEDDKVDIQIPSEMIIDESDNEEAMIDLDDTISADQQAEMEEFDRKLSAILTRSKIAAPTGENSKLHFFFLVKVLLSSKAATPDILKMCLVFCFDRVSVASCPEQCKQRVFECFEAQVCQNRASLEVLMQLFDSESAKHFCTSMLSCMFTGVQLDITPGFWKVVVKFFTCVFARCDANCQQYIVDYFKFYLAEFLARKQYTSVKDFLMSVNAIRPEMFWKFFAASFDHACATSKKEVAVLTNNSMELLIPDVVNNIPENSEVAEFVPEFCRKMLVESVKQSCSPLVRKKYIQFVYTIALKHSPTAVKGKLRARVLKTLQAFEGLEKDQTMINFLRNLKNAFKIGDDVLAGISYFKSKEKPDQKKRKLDAGGAEVGGDKNPSKKTTKKAKTT